MNKKYLLYVGLFVAGAVITPMYLSLFGSGDRSSTSETKPTEATGFVDNTNTNNTNLFNAADSSGSTPTPGFAPDDSREMIEQDYTIQLRSTRTATTLPQFAREQAPPAPYPNYAAIPAPQISIPATVTPKPAIAPKKSPQSTSDTLTGLNPDRAIALDTAKPLQNSIQSVPANTLFTPRPEGNNAQHQNPMLDKNPNNIQTDWLRNNTNRPAATGETPLNTKP